MENGTIARTRAATVPDAAAPRNSTTSGLEAKEPDLLRVRWLLEVEVVFRGHESTELPMNLEIRDSDGSARIELAVASKNHPRILERLVGPALPEGLTEEDERPHLDDPGGNIGLAVEDNDMSRARSGRVDELELDLERASERLPIDVDS